MAGIIYLVLEYIVIFAVMFAAFAFTMDRIFRSTSSQKKFFNIGAGTKAASGIEDDRGRLAMLKWLISRDKNVWANAEVTQTKPAERVEGDSILVTYINHATVLIQTAGLNIITDPVYVNRASPVQWLGPKRYAKPGVAFDDLPKLDVVLLSHNHYDHMDIATLRRIAKRDNPAFFVPFGNKAFLKRHGIEAVELDWWQSSSAKSADGPQTLSLELVPSQHFSARALSDRNKTLWGGYVLKLPTGDIYFAGDTGYGPFVDQIKARFPGGFRLGLLPIGAYLPEWIMSEVHVSPDQALQMKRELGVKTAVAIHFGTFKLADDRQGQPAKRIAEIASTAESFKILQNGESLRL